MRFLIILSVMTLAVTLHAQASFEALIQRHSTMVDNSGEVFIELELVQSEDYAELGDVMDSISFPLGMDGLELRPVDGKQKKAEVVSSLMEGWLPYFCGAFNEGDWSDDEALCAENLEKLFGDAIDTADRVYLLNAYGDYYGDWAEKSVILQDYESKQSLVLRFDILHEI